MTSIFSKKKTMEDQQSFMSKSYSWQKNNQSSDEQTRQQSIIMRREYSLKLFHGIPQLPEPQPQTRTQQTFDHENIKQISIHPKSRNRQKSIDLIKQRNNFLPISQVANALSKLGSNYQNLFTRNIKIQNQYIEKLQNKIYLLQKQYSKLLNVISQNQKQNKLEKQQNLRTITNLNQQITFLNKIPNFPKKYKSLVIDTQFDYSQSPVLFNSFQNSRYQQDEVSLLDQIEQQIAKQNVSYEHNMILPVTNSKNKVLHQPMTKKKALHILPGKQKVSNLTTTSKKERKSSILRHNNSRALIIEEEQLSSLSSSSQFSEKEEKRTHKKYKQSQKPRKQLLFEQQTKNKQKPFLESQVEEFQIKEISSYKRPSLNVDSLISEQQLLKNYNLSPEEKYLLHEIKQLKGTLMDGSIVSEQKQLWVKNYESSKKVYPQQNTQNNFKNQAKILKILKKTQQQLKILKKNLIDRSFLIPCQYCQYKKFIHQTLENWQQKEAKILSRLSKFNK